MALYTASAIRQRDSPLCTYIDPEFPLSRHGAAAIESRNALHLFNLKHCDLGITPTQWQYSLHPKAYRHKLRVIHEGIDLEKLGPNPDASLTLPNGEVLKAGDPVVTYVARNLEPYRGFHWFMRELVDSLKQREVVAMVTRALAQGYSGKDLRSSRAQPLMDTHTSQEYANMKALLIILFTNTATMVLTVHSAHIKRECLYAEKNDLLLVSRCNFRQHGCLYGCTSYRNRVYDYRTRVHQYVEGHARSHEK